MGESGFGDVVAAFLREKGYAVDRDVGCGAIRIDVAVRHPDDADRYLMGVECDGPAYAAQRTAQDRDVNRAGVLNGLGWRMCRVWSVDWAFDRERSQQRLVEALENARRGVSEPAKPAPVASPSPAPVAATSAPASAAPSSASQMRSEYRVWTGDEKYDRAFFYEPSSRQRIAQTIAAVIEAEGPICESVLRKRVCAQWGVTRLTENAVRVFDATTPSAFAVTDCGAGKVYWPRGTEPQDYRAFRVPSAEKESKRAPDEIPPEELANAMRETLSDLGKCSQDALYRETLRLFGASALTVKSRQALDVAFGLIG